MTAGRSSTSARRGRSSPAPTSCPTPAPKAGLNALTVGLARAARDVSWVDVLLSQLETKLGLRRRIALEVLVEESEGLANAVEIARASDRLEAIIFGAGDLSASQRARVDGNFDPVGDYPGDFWHFARFQVVTAARIAGIDAIDAPYPAYRDSEGYRRSAVHASLLGFDGKWAIHPSQVPIAHEVFSPTDAEVADARAAIAAYRRSEAGGVGAIGRDGRLVDAAHMRLAENTLHKAELARADRGTAAPTAAASTSPGAGGAGPGDDEDEA
ncbi:MAG TPA: aldolase/citrate lyase family protein [Acidimicrobiales bacterium]